MRHVAVIPAALLVSAFCSLAVAQNPQPAPKPPRKAVPVSVTFTKDIAPIVYGHCVTCHRPGATAPMSLVTYQEVRRYALNIRYAAVNREMPPHTVWVPEDPVHTARLDEREVALIAKWVDQGAPEGDPKDLPPLPPHVRKLPKPAK